MAEQRQTLLSVTGEVTADTVIADAVVTVKLVDAGGEVLAGGAAIAPTTPAEFVLTADPALVPDASQLSVWAAVRTDDGLWGTPELVRVVDQPLEVPVVRIPD